MPGQDNPNSKVHAVCGQKPLCGARFHPRAEYQFCSNGLAYGYVECSKCKEIINKQGIKAAKATPLKGKREVPMTEAQAMEEISRVSDNLDHLTGVVIKLKKRLDTAWAVLAG
jgi:hypothetical protein